MKRYIYTFLFATTALFCSLPVAAQMKTSYFMEGSTQRLDMNASFIPKRGYVNIPGIGNIGINANSNYLSIRNFLYPNPEGAGLVTFMHESVSSDTFLQRLRNKNNLNIGVRENIVGFGGFERRYFWNFAINLRSESSLTIPKDFFELAKTMQTGNYNLRNFKATTDNYLEFAIGFVFPFPIYEKINVGFRAKVLAGAAHAALNIDNMSVNINDEEWRANLQGTLQGNVAGFNLSTLSGQMTLDQILERLDDNQGSDRITFSPSNLGSWGLALDLGADARLLDDRLKVSIGLNDLGFISWSRKSAINGSLSDLSVAFKGYDFDAGEVDMEKPDDILLNIADPKNTTRMLTATLNIGGEYTILDNAIGFGVLSQTRFLQNYTSTELTVSANFRPSHWFSASLSHSLIQNRLGVFGLALNVHPSWINFFVGCDYLGLHYGKYNGAEWIPINMKSVNVYLGLAVPITRPKPHGSFESRVHKR